MRVIVDEAAWSDLDKIVTWIAKDSPEAARRELEKIEHVIKQLGRFPGLSRQGRAKGTFESVLQALPTSLSSSSGRNWKPS